MCLPGTKQPVCSFLMFGVSASIDNIEKYVLAKQKHYLKNMLKITPTCQSQLKFSSQSNSQDHFVCEIGKVEFDYNHMQKESRKHIFVVDCSVSQSYLTPCSPMDCSMSGFSVLHHLPESAPTHVQWVSDAIQNTSHPLSSPSPPAFNPSQHQSLFQ